MLVNYINVVSNCLKESTYCLLNQKVRLTIYYRLLKPTTDGQIITSNPEEEYAKALGPFNFVIVTNNASVFYLHKSKDITTNDLKLQCLHLWLDQGKINKTFNKSFSLFEEEIYFFITCLNFDPIKIRDFLGLTFAEATQFIPDNLKMAVTGYRTLPVDVNACTDALPFGRSSKTVLHSREIDGHISSAKATRRILSLNYRKGFEDSRPERPNWIHTVNPYVVYYAADYNAYIPLAFNPFENPIIRDD